MSGDLLAYTVTATAIGVAFCLMAVWPSLFPRVQSVRVDEEDAS